MFPERLETDSLVLTRMSPDTVDVFDLYDLFAEGSDTARGVFEYIPQESFGTVNDAHEWIEVADDEWAERESARYVIARGEDTLVGAAVLDLEWDRRKGSIAVILARPFWGNGYAGECAEALMDLAFDRLALEVVTLGYDDGNDRSQAAIESLVDRLGGQYGGVVRNATDRGDEVVDAYTYSVTREQFRSASDGQ